MGDVENDEECTKRPSELDTASSEAILAVEVALAGRSRMNNISNNKSCHFLVLYTGFCDKRYACVKPRTIGLGHWLRCPG